MPNPFLKPKAFSLTPLSFLDGAPGRRVGPAGRHATPWNCSADLIMRPAGSNSYAFSEGKMVGTKVVRHPLGAAEKQVRGPGVPSTPLGAHFLHW